MGRRATGGMLVGAGALLLAACQEGTATDDWEVCPLAVTVRVTVAAGQPPRVSWTPDCRLHAIVFGSASDETQFYWSAATTGNELVGPVTYGRTPARATTSAAAPALAPGGYRVILYEVVPGFPSPVSQEIGRASFTIP